MASKLAEKYVYKPFGNQAVLIIGAARISEKISADLQLFSAKIRHYLSDEISDIIMGYHSLAVVFKRTPINFSAMVEKLTFCSKKPLDLPKNISHTWEIPVCYHPTFGPDLQLIAQQKKLGTKEVIALHTQAVYRVFFIGFLPGFLYLGGLASRLHTPRKATPRHRIPQGSVGIGGQQTGIYPFESAAGWQIIGKTPLPLFEPHKTPPCFAKTGDKIVFRPIEPEEFAHISRKIETGKYLLKPQKI